MAGVYLVNEEEAMMEIEGFQGNAEEQILETFEYAGEFFKKHARMNRKFGDVTGALKASIGYGVGIDGKIVAKDTTGDNAEGVKEAEAGLNEILSENNKGIVLIGLAGMEYGVYVENMKQKSVISQSVSPTEKLLNDLLE